MKQINDIEMRLRSIEKRLEELYLQINTKLDTMNSYYAQVLTDKMVIKNKVNKNETTSISKAKVISKK